MKFFFLITLILLYQYNTAYLKCGEIEFLLNLFALLTLEYRQYEQSLSKLKNVCFNSFYLHFKFISVLCYHLIYITLQSTVNHIFNH